MVVYSCPDSSFDPSTSTCSSPVWVYQQDGLLPPLSISDASLIAAQIVALWGLGFGFKLLRRFLFR